MMRLPILLAAALLVPTPAAAQPALRTIEVPADAPWQHAASGIVLPAQALGMRRTALRDSTAGELDVWASYDDPAAGLVASIYIYKTQLPDASLWFDRALEVVRLVPEWNIGAAPRAVGIPFSPPGSSVASGMIAGFEVNGLGRRGSALAVAPLGKWLVKLRLSSRDMNGAATQERLRALIAALRWPDSGAAVQPGKAILPCPDTLAFKKARVIKPDMMQSLLGGLLGVTSSLPKKAEAPPTYCRETGATLAYGVYRPDASTNSYVVTIGDGGIALSVQPALTLEALEGKKSGANRWSMSLIDRGGVGVLPLFNRLPPPDQAYDVARKNPPGMSMQMGN